MRRYAGRIFSFLRRDGFAEADAEDLVQDTFVRVSQNLRRYDPHYAVSTWLFTIARRLAIDWRRSHGRDRAQRQEQIEAVAPAAPAPTEDDGGVWELARRALPPRQFDALWLFYGEDLSMSELARVMEVSMSNAKVLVHRGRTRLAELLGSREGAEDVA